MSEQEQEKVEERVYTGRRIDPDSNKIRYVWETHANGASWWHTKQPVPSASIGAVYVCTVAGEKSVYIKGDKAPRYLHRAELPAGVLAQWVAADTAVGNEQARRAAITKAGRVHPLEAQLLGPPLGDPGRRAVRASYWRLRDNITGAAIPLPDELNPAVDHQPWEEMTGEERHARLADFHGLGSDAGHDDDHHGETV